MNKEQRLDELMQARAQLDSARAALRRAEEANAKLTALLADQPQRDWVERWIDYGIRIVIAAGVGCSVAAVFYVCYRLISLSWEFFK